MKKKDFSTRTVRVNYSFSLKKSCRRDQKMVPETYPTNLNWLKSAGQVPRTFTTNYLGP